MVAKYPKQGDMDDPEHKIQSALRDLPLSKTATGELTTSMKNGRNGRYSRKRNNGPSAKQTRPDRRCKYKLEE